VSCVRLKAPELVSRLAALERFGKAIAIKAIAFEAFEALEDARACPALVGLLADNETAVEWSARAPGSRGCGDAIEPRGDPSFRASGPAVD
jgi:hypothetical protein